MLKFNFLFIIYLLAGIVFHFTAESLHFLNHSTRTFLLAQMLPGLDFQTRALRIRLTHLARLTVDFKNDALCIKVFQVFLSQQCGGRESFSLAVLCPPRHYLVDVSR